jgi:hypothetical protein
MVRMKYDEEDHGWQEHEEVLSSERGGEVRKGCWGGNGNTLVRKKLAASLGTAKCNWMFTCTLWWIAI